MKLIAPDPEMRVAMPYAYTAKALLTPTEARFHSCLLQITQERCRIQIKPRLADVFEHEKVNGAFQMISQKHIDFLICRNEDWMPMLGIELDDASHNRAETKKRDMFVNLLFASTGVPLLRLPVAELDHLERLVEELTKAWYHRCGLLEAATPSAA
jgi:hypothetical protein